MNTNKNDTSLEARVLRNIEEQKIAPRSRAYFVVRNVLMWVLALLALIVGALVISGVIFRLHNMGMVLPPDMAMPTPPVIFRLVPLLWVLLIALFAYLAYREIRATDTGYRYKLSTIVLALVGGSTVLGFALALIGSGRALDRFMDAHVPFHERMEELQERTWLLPEKGLIIGTFEGREGFQFIVRTRDGERWIVEEGVTLPPQIVGMVLPSTTVGVRGMLLDKEAHTFRACDLHTLALKERPFMKERIGGHDDERGDGMRERLAYERKRTPPRSTPCEARTASTTTVTN